MLSTKQRSVSAASPRRAYAVALLGVSAVSLGAIFIRLAQTEDIPSLFIAAARLTIASLILTPIILRHHLPDIRALKRNDLLLGLASGLFLALHFATWIVSLEYTSVLISVTLVTTSPLWVALLEVFILRAALGRLVILGLVIGLIGSVIAALSSGGGDLGNEPLTGSLLATTGAVCLAVYFVIGRKLRARLDLLPYIWLVYGCAAIILLVVVLLMNIPVIGYPANGYLWLLAMAVVPQLLGHSSYNYALKFLPATVVGVISQLEPVLSALAAAIVFSELPDALQIIGSATILAGVLLATLGQNRR